MPDADAAAAVSPQFPSQHSWNDRPTEADLAPLPACPGVYCLLDGNGAAVQLATTQHLRRGLSARLLSGEEAASKRADLAEITRSVRWCEVSSPFEARWRYYHVARLLFPAKYRELISFGPAHFLHIDWGSRVPEIRASERIWCTAGEFIGSWPSRPSCQQAVELLWDFFDLCRHPEEVRRAPHGRRCAYADMGRCDAPCDGSSALAAYAERCHAAWRFASGEAGEWRSGTETRMHAAAAQQRFEQAALLKQQLAAAAKWAREWSALVCRDHDLVYLLVLPVTRRKAWKPFLFRHGNLCDGPILQERQLPMKAVEWLRSELAGEPTATPDDVRMEQTWLLAHLLHHKDAERSIIVRLPGGQPPGDLHQRLVERLSQLRARKKPDDEYPGDSES